MNSGKVCVTVCAATADEFNEKIKTASGLADLTELRFDCLDENEFERIEIPFNENFIQTFRPADQGGARKLNIEDRRDFWNTTGDFCGADLEEDVVENALFRGFRPKICSFHDFSGVPADLPEIFERLAATGCDVVKLAVRADDAVDSIAVWNLLDLAHSRGVAVIPIAMGESGKWTRILGLAHGAYLTYASLETGSETAPGQISVRDMIDVYRVKELDRDTHIYGIIGGGTSHSMSPYIHNAVFRENAENAVFVPFQGSDVDAFFRRFVNPETREVDLDLRGFAVTIPHKQAVIPHLDEIDDTAAAVGAVNTIRIDGGKLYGSNTDAAGFIAPLLRRLKDLNGANVAVIGAGGAARACVHALLREGAGVTVFARDPQKAEALAAEFGARSAVLPDLAELPGRSFSEFDILVNATPLGMSGKAEGKTPAQARHLAGLKLVYDLIYTPLETPLLIEAAAAGVETLGGLEMLIAQAAEQQFIWTGRRPSPELMHRAAIERLFRKN